MYIQVIKPFPASYFYVRSSSGFLVIDQKTGEVIDIELSEAGEHYKREKDPYGIHNIRKFDIEEHLKQGRMLTSTMSYDILDFGYWLASGEYIKPEYNWRRMMVREFGKVNSEREHDPHYAD